MEKSYHQRQILVILCMLRPGTELRIVDGKIPGNVYARLEGTEEDVAYEIVLSYPTNRLAKYVLKTVDYVDDKIKYCLIVKL